MCTFAISSKSTISNVNIPLSQNNEYLDIFNSNLSFYRGFRAPKVYFDPNAIKVRADAKKGNIIIYKANDKNKDNSGKKGNSNKYYKHDILDRPECFALLDSEVSLFWYLCETPIVDRVFYESIRNGDQKPRFDLDFKPDDFPNITREEVYNYLNLVINAIATVMKRFNVDYSYENNCLVFSSHGPNNINDNRMKYSFHIVIDKLMHANNLESSAFYELVFAELPEDVRSLKFLDPQVYMSFQEFRMLFCQKKDSGRIKLLDPITKYIPYYDEDPEDPVTNVQLKMLALLRASLLSFTSECEKLPSFINESNKIVKSKVSHTELTSVQYEDLFNCFAKQPYSN
jgi:hypothetical protein